MISTSVPIFLASSITLGSREGGTASTGGVSLVRESFHSAAEA